MHPGLRRCTDATVNITGANVEIRRQGRIVGSGLIGAVTEEGAGVHYRVSKCVSGDSVAKQSAAA